MRGFLSEERKDYVCDSGVCNGLSDPAQGLK